MEEQPIEMPTINQEESYSGKKKRHTTKNQIITDNEGTRILNRYNAIVKTEEMKIGGDFDSGYQGIQKELSNAVIPFKKSKNHELTEEEKAYNKELSRQRIKIEHVNRQIKIFRIMKDVYGNHMNRYDEKLTIMCCI